MALLIAFTLHDVKAVVYSPPFFASNEQIAKRMVSDLVADGNTTVGRHPADFKLYKIGTFDEGNAALLPLPIPEHVVDCIALVHRPSRDYFTQADMWPVDAARPNGEAK